MDQQVEWIKIAESIVELTSRRQGKIIELEMNGKLVCLINDHDKLYACSGNCPHAGGKLSDGCTDGRGNIVCPVHRYRFRLSNGYNSSGEGFHLRTYPVIENEEGVFVGFPPTPGFL